MKATEEREFTPALGYALLTPLYDLAIAALTRESTWRDVLLTAIAPMPDERILDVGCGTGSLALQIKAVMPSAEVVGIDPDPQVLARAVKKANARSLEIKWHQGFLTTEFLEAFQPFSTVVSSLVFHQTPVDEKRGILTQACQALTPGGNLYVADYGFQQSTLMRLLYRCTVQVIDGRENTTPNAQGKLPDYMREAGFEHVDELRTIPTFTGSISIYRAQSSTTGDTHASIPS